MKRLASSLVALATVASVTVVGAPAQATGFTNYVYNQRGSEYLIVTYTDSNCSQGRVVKYPGSHKRPQVRSVEVFSDYKFKSNKHGYRYGSAGCVRVNAGGEDYVSFKTFPDGY